MEDTAKTCMKKILDEALNQILELGKISNADIDNVAKCANLVSKAHREAMEYFNTMKQNFNK
ncbi:hypothetical protein CDJ58_03870 [Campylobacter lari]|uniref:Uncharacterized protein n=1 Tax=Campylobacter peloridis TaxID=488546 RepID=A0A5C7DNE3_9BACT|nr:hypothetical protein [Campylobacter peloridis]EAH8851067.1 hypothetical protein [Campylobacter lari]EAK5748537.1 hypothetical protein [Campylobacter lari]EAK9878390.1 hypothetical protein [Campylobacter lari]TXE79678.1 hypothetical protein FPD46_06330 [Campylobacter peloridis]TXE84740.1 hypothetical protein FPD46_00460 [Campylobacter peloridis]